MNNLYLLSNKEKFDRQQKELVSQCHTAVLLMKKRIFSLFYIYIFHMRVCVCVLLIIVHIFQYRTPNSFAEDDVPFNSVVETG